MKLDELKTILQATGIPVAYSHFEEAENQPLPQPPYLLYLAAYSSNFMADNKVHIPIENVQIELYTSKKDLEAEAKVESVLNEHELPFATTEAFIDSEQLHQKIYEVRLF
jgi:hypothetical protein